MDFAGFFQDLRIWFSFLGYDRRARAACRTEAQRIFNTSELENDLQDRRAKLELKSLRMWGAEIERRESEALGADHEVRGLETELDFFRRDYRGELDQAYQHLNKIKEEQRSCKDELSEAHEALKEARSEIQSWHAKSTRTPWLFGNAGRPLPKHSLFGQSFGDLDGLKAARESAVYSIRTATGRRAALNSSFQQALASIQKIKSDRERMFDLRKSGRNATFLERRIFELRKFAAKSRGRAAKLRARRTAWEASEMESMGIKALEDSIREMKKSHQEYLTRFDSAEELAKRKAAHRAAWLREQVI